MFKPDARREFLNLTDRAPDFEFDQLDCGVRAAAIRILANGATYARISHFIMPFIGAVPVGSMVDNRLDGFKAVYQVPSDNLNTWRYDFFFKWSRPFSQADSSKRDFVDAGYKKLRNKRNNYLQDRQLQKSVNFSGITEFLNQDACATESMGAVVDRSREHAGASDAFIPQVRRFILRAVKDVQAGKPGPGAIFPGTPNEMSHLRCEAAQLPADVSWRSLYETT